MEFQLSYFKSLKMMLWNCCTQYAGKFGKLSSGHRTVKVSFHSNPKERPKNVHITIHLHSSHTLAKKCSKFSMPGFTSTWELPYVQAGIRKGRRTRDWIPNICWIIEKAKELQKNICFSFTDYPKFFDSVDHNKLWKILKEMGISDYLTCLLTKLYAGQEAPVRTGHGTTEWFQIGKGVCPGCILSPCLTYMQSISCEMPGWMKH